MPSRLTKRLALDLLPLEPEVERAPPPPPGRKHWTCHLCGLPVPRLGTLGSFENDARKFLCYTRDHVVPLSEQRQLSNTQRPINGNEVRPAHRLCNSTRGSMNIDAYRGSAKAAEVRQRVLSLMRKHMPSLLASV